MSRLEGEIEPEDPLTEQSWQINREQVNKLVEKLRNYPNFQRILAKPDGPQLPANMVVWFVEPLPDSVLNILVEKTEQRGVFILTANRGAAPVIRDILGTDLPPFRFAA